MTIKRRLHPNCSVGHLKEVFGVAAFALLLQTGWAVAQSAPPTVSVEAVQYKELRSKATFGGRVEAVSKIELRARLEGLITSRAFEEGSEVKKGQLLFEIERRPYEIAVAQAEAALAASMAALDAAEASYNRIQDLQERQISSEASLESAKSAYAQSKAKVGLDQANLEQAKLSLSYTKIVAETDGRVGRAAHAVGDIVNASSTPLATLVSQDPVYVAFAMPKPLVASLLKQNGASFGAEVELNAKDEVTHPYRGKIAFVDVEANAATDTVIVRATVPNPGRELIPQQLVDVTVVDVAATKSLAISQSALLLDQLGSYVLVLDKSNRVEVRRFESGEQFGSMIAVKSGLAEGDRVIVGGHVKAQPGMIVTPENAPLHTSNSSSDAGK